MTTIKLTKLIKDCKFDWVNSDITDDIFPEPKEISTEYDLMTIDKYMSSEDIIAQIGEDYRPANAWELLEYAKKDWNGIDWVVALGSVGGVDGDRDVLCLYRDYSKRGLHLHWWGFDWDSRYRFLRVRNSVTGTSETKTLGDSDTLKLGACCPHCHNLVNITLSK